MRPRHDRPTTTTKYYRIKVYVGPVHVDHYGAQATRAGLTGVWTGTEHVYGVAASTELTSEGDRQVFRQQIAGRDVTILGAD